MYMNEKYILFGNKEKNLVYYNMKKKWFFEKGKRYGRILFFEKLNG